MNDQNKKNDSVPYIVHESIMARMERAQKRLFILCLVIFLLFVCSNCAWLWYESQFQYAETTTTTQTVTQDGGDGGNNNFVGGDNIGEPNSEDENK